jgi:hypothetical protein
MTEERVRQHIVDFLRREIVGPDPGFPAMQLNREEVLRAQDPPRLRYGAGVLFPLRASVDLQDDTDPEEVSGAVADSPTDGGILETEEHGARALSKAVGEAPPETDYEVNRANDFLPSAMGLSALVRMPRRLRVRVSAGRYERQELSGQGWTDRNGKFHKDTAWWRIPVEGELLFDCAALVGPGYIATELPVAVNGIETGLHVHVLSRPAPGQEQGIRIVTVTLINRKQARNLRPADDECFFQCGFEMSAPDGASCILEYPERPSNLEGEEEASLRLLYRHRKVFAVGHGCAPDWADPIDAHCAMIRTESLPVFETKPILPRDIPGLHLAMLTLADDTGERSMILCRRLADEYEKWIVEQERVIETGGDITEDMRTAARRHVGRCRDCLGRIRAGIHLVESEATVRKAFALMNQAMMMQQIHYEIASTKPREWRTEGRRLVLAKPFEQPSYDDPERRWRPFQLAFILMTLKAIAEPESSDRRIVDLIWFPTGGGKTEAYLGLSAFCIFLRRLRNPRNAGTAVLMRYTLRLLTAQQYLRAASLICACEKLRREDPTLLGGAPITIGLWVGGDVTPNDQRAAAASLQGLLNGQEQNKFIVISCPWCGAQMGPVRVGGTVQCRGYQRVSNPLRVVFKCEDPDCAFSDRQGLPLKVIDTDIYAEPPALLVGTVDKFAMLPWRPEARRLFGLGGAGSPPELVIQDELHLISGPLGSMVGHYETVIDALCSQDRKGGSVRPKTIASTATISKAEEQVKALYGRSRDEVFLFPPQGLTAGDSFFAEERTDQVGRRYVGVLASALPSHVTAQVRVMSALLQAIKTAPVDEPEALDPYWTMVGYFNSLRELGHASTMIRADIREYLNAMWDRTGLTVAFGGEEAKERRRFINRDLELTSRVQSGQIAELLQQLFIRYDGARHSEVVDVCFATNMIQVGLDVPRLSLMTIVGQPKTTSEYIQASSRVGRLHPGLVVTNYNPAKPRDRSHFEHFRAYHESIYRYVEPTSVTPFAVPVRERALHALIVTLVRFWGDVGLRERPQPPPDDTLIARIRAAVLERVASTDPEEQAETDVMIRQIVEAWRTFQPPKYGDFGPLTEECPLMYPSGSQQHPFWNDRPFATPTSMRNVDASCDARVLNAYPESS